MATRLYFGNLDVASSVFQPGLSDITWGTTEYGTWSSSSSTENYLAPHGHPSIAAYGGVVRNLPTGASTSQILRCQAVSPPMQAGYVWDTSTWSTVCRQAQSVDANTFMMFYVGIISNTGTLKFMTTLEKDGVDNAISTTAASRHNAMAAGKLVGTSVPGDRIFVEIGQDKDSATSSDLRMSFFYNSGTGDFTTTDGTTTVLNQWLETNLNIVFDNEGTTYGSVPNQLMMQGCGQ